MSKTKCTTTNCQLLWLVILRVAIGWHFLYEGITKILNPNWSAVGYLLDAKGFFSFFYHGLAANPQLLSVCNFMNEWGLTLIGLGLIMGTFTKIATYSGMLLLVFYYLSHPPFVGLTYAMPTEGSYLFVDKVFIEFCAMGVLALFPTGKYIGLDRLIFKRK